MLEFWNILQKMVNYPLDNDDTYGIIEPYQPQEIL